jgi:hypothetical protein
MATEGAADGRITLLQLLQQQIEVGEIRGLLDRRWRWRGVAVPRLGIG